MACSRCGLHGHTRTTCSAEKIDLPRIPTEPVPDDGLTHDQRRSRRHREVRKVTVNMKRYSRTALAEEGERLSTPSDIDRPRTRADCEMGDRPCPFVSCKHHLYLDVGRSGSLILNFPDIEPDEMERMEETCALDVADEGGATLEHVGEIMNLTRERVRQMELQIYAKVRAVHGVVLEELSPSGDVKKRRLPVVDGRGTPVSVVNGRTTRMLRLRAEGYTHAEIGEMVGLAKNTVSGILSRIRSGNGAEVVALRRPGVMEPEDDLALQGEEEIA